MSRVNSTKPGDFVTAAAHELRNPLAVILARAQLLLLEIRDGSEWSREGLEKSLRMIEAQTLRASLIVETLTASARQRGPGAARVEFPMERTDS